MIPGPFSSEAAAAAAGLSTIKARDALSGLVRCSLLTPLGVAGQGRPSRFRQLTPIRAAARAMADGAATQRHVDQRDAWVCELAAALPRAGSAHDASSFGRIDDDLSAVNATLQHGLVDSSSPVGAIVASRLGLYWYYRGMGPEWNTWTRLAASSSAAHEADRILAGLSFTCATGLAGRSDLGRSSLAAAEDFLREQRDEELTIRLGDAFFHVANTARATRDTDLGVQAAEAVRQQAERTGDSLSHLLAEIAALLAAANVGDSTDLLPRSEAAYTRALDCNNSYAAWSARRWGRWPRCGALTRPPGCDGRIEPSAPTCSWASIRQWGRSLSGGATGARRPIPRGGVDLRRGPRRPAAVASGGRGPRPRGTTSSRPTPTSRAPTEIAQSAKAAP